MAVPKYLGVETEYGLVVTGGPAFDHAAVSSLVVGGWARYEGTAGVRWGGTDVVASPVADPGFTEDGLHEPPPETPAGDAADHPLRNGARFYVDHAHPEYATPECANPRDAVLWDKAGERIVEAAADLATRVLHERGAPDSVRVLATKNNTDGKGASYGTHENYLVDRATAWDDLVRQLIPFLVTRQVAVGAGRAGSERDAAAYQLSQRSEFFESQIGAETMRSRPIINTRDEPHADPARFRRFHVIIGDANMSEVCTYLKLGSCALVLMMVEDGFLPEPPDLARPVPALHQVAADLTCARPVELADGRTATPVELQWHYLGHARAYLDQRGAPAWGYDVVATWERVLTALERDPSSLAGTVDWVTKHALLARYADRHGLSWADDRITLVDVLYHDVSRTTGGYNRLAARGRVRTLVSADDVRDAMSCPPRDTRAWFRGHCLAAYPGNLAQVDWGVVTFGGAGGRAHRVTLPTPGPVTAAAADLLAG